MSENAVDEEANLAMAQFVMTARLYDAVMLSNSIKDPLNTEKLADVHQAGHLMCAEPNFTGLFLGSMELDEVEAMLQTQAESDDTDASG